MSDDSNTNDGVEALEKLLNLSSIIALQKIIDELKKRIEARDTFIAAFEIDVLGDLGDGKYLHTQWDELKIEYLGKERT